MNTEKTSLENESQPSCLGSVMRSRFNKGDIVICWLKGGSYEDKFTVLEDTGGLTLLCHKTGGLCIVNNREDYDFA
jgi:hypothetical protein